MIIEWLVFVGAAIGTFVIGTPIAVALAGQHRWIHPATRETTTRKQRTDVVRAYAPLDLGIDPVRWPSERLWELKSTLGIPEWPSKSWNDEHFGRSRKDAVVQDASEQGFHAMAARRHREEGSPNVIKPPPRIQAATATATAERDAPAREPQRRERTTAAQRRRQTGDAARPTPEPARMPASSRGTAADSPPATPPSRAKPPDEAEIEHLIASVGLAGTVQAIMQRTGWDFRDAAQYLARVRRSP